MKGDPIGAVKVVDFSFENALLYRSVQVSIQRLVPPYPSPDITKKSTLLRFHKGFPAKVNSGKCKKSRIICAKPKHV